MYTGNAKQLRISPFLLFEPTQKGIKKYKNTSTSYKPTTCETLK